MSSNVDVVRSFLERAWANPPESLLEATMETLSDDFKQYDESGNVLADKQAYIGMGQMMFGSLKDFNWVLRDLREEDGGVVMTGHFEGTHTGDLDLSPMGLGVIPATGNRIVWPEVEVKWSVDGDKLTSEEPYGGATGMAAFLAPLGVKLPSG